MKARKLWIAAIALAAAGGAAFYFAGPYSERSRREAFVYRCNEEGAGGMITSRQYCEELYARGKGESAPADNAN
jgi:hypothetical protein